MPKRVTLPRHARPDAPAPAPVSGRAAVLARLSVLAATLLWGTTGTAQAIGPDGLDPVALGYARLLFGTAALVIVTIAVFGPSALAWFFTGERRRWVLIAAVAVGGYQVAFFAGVGRVGVAIGTLIALGSAPVFTGLFAAWLMREGAEPGWRTATLLAVAGCACIMLPGQLSGTGVDPIGVGLTLTAGLCYGVYTVALKRLLREPPVLPALSATLTAGTVVLTAVAGPYLLLRPEGVHPLLSGDGAVLVGWLGVATIALAYLLFVAGLSRVPAATVGTLALGEPLVAAVLGIGVVGERPTAAATAGGALLLAGLALMTIGLPTRRPTSRRWVSALSADRARYHP